MTKPNITMIDNTGRLRTYTYDGGELMEQTDEYGGVVEYKVVAEGNKPDTTSAYTDRMYQWDSSKYNRACKEVWGNEGQLWDNRNVRDIEKFLKGYTGRECRLLQKVRYTNQASGFPVWRLEWQYLTA